MSGHNCNGIDCPTCLRAERDVLRSCVREVGRLYPNLALPWMRHSPCDEAWRRALAQPSTITEASANGGPP